MAYMDQQKKLSISVEIKKAIPKGWKYSLSVKNHSTIRLTIQSAPIDLIAECKYENKDRGYLQLNEYYLERAFDGDLLKIFESAKAALNLNNFNRSDIQTDYFCVGHYVEIHIGCWDKPFSVSAA